MRFGIAAAALALVCAGPVGAAKFLVVDVIAHGTGRLTTGNRTLPGPPVLYDFTDYYASLAYYLDGPFGPQYTASGVQLVGSITLPLETGREDSTGFSFGVFAASSDENYTVSGNGCFANPTPTVVPNGFLTTDPACSQISAVYSNPHLVRGYTFSGLVTSLRFTVVEAQSLPNTVLAIPEPAIWAMMILGFALVSFLGRRRAPLRIALPDR